MGKGDIKSFRGKLFNHSYGIYRPKRIYKRFKTRQIKSQFMKEYRIRHLRIYKFDYQFEDKYRTELSDILIEKFGKGPYNSQDKVREAIVFCYNFFCDKLVDICSNEKSLAFYQLILSQHEQAIEAALFANDKDFPNGIDRKYIAVYRRILKWILEEACNIKLSNSELPNEKFVVRAKNVLNELCYIGDMIFTCANIYAEQDMIEDVAEFTFDSEDKYIIGHRHHYDYIIGEIHNQLNAVSFKHVVDEEALNDLKNAILDCFGIEYDHFSSIVASIHEANRTKGGQYCPFGWNCLALNIQSVYNEDITEAEIFYKGLTLDKTNKLKLHDLACKPLTLFRYMYRPITIWNIEGEDFAIVGKNAFTESIIQLATNCIPWGKAPQEWMTKNCFKDYVHTKEDLHDKWLDDKVEELIQKEGLQYHRNVTFLNSDSGIVTLNLPNVGEIDFIIIDHQTKKIFIADCKHLQGKYDMMAQKNDYTNFTKPSKGYNKQISNKIAFISSNLGTLNYHNKNKYGHDTSDLVDYEIEGIFIINQPTFYMYNSDFRIYTIDILIDKVKNRIEDPELLVTVVENDTTEMLRINYPYFRKPDYSLVSMLEDE